MESVETKLSAQLKILDISVGQMNSSLGNLAGGMEERFSALSGRLDTLDANVDHITTSLTGECTLPFLSLLVEFLQDPPLMTA